MQFSEALTKPVKDVLQEKGITMEESELQGVFNNAFTSFVNEGVLSSGATTMSVPQYLAAQALKAAFADPEDDTEAPETPE